MSKAGASARGDAAPGPGQRPAVLAIDGGNSKTDLALVGLDGTLLAVVRGPGASPYGLGMAAAVQVLGDLVALATREAGLAAARAPVAQHACAFLAGADLPEEEVQIAEALRAQGWGATTHVSNDTFAVLRAGTSRGWGVAVTCGAGINCVGIGPDGRTTRFPALGQFTGDWGGGLWLAMEVMWWAMRAEDGRGRETALRAATAAHFGARTVREVAVRHHFGQLTVDDLAQLTHVLFRVAAQGDEVARALVARQAQEIAVMATTAMRRLGLLGLDTDVVLGGGVLAARDPLLISEVRDRLRLAAPRARPRLADLPPIAGAALLGLEHVAAPQAAADRLRAAFTGGGDVISTR